MSLYTLYKFNTRVRNLFNVLLTVPTEQSYFSAVYSIEFLLQYTSNAILTSLRGNSNSMNSNLRM